MQNATMPPICGVYVYCRKRRPRTGAGAQVGEVLRVWALQEEVKIQILGLREIVLARQSAAREEGPILVRARQWRER
jgi:hypothetical protein